jgi:hypothetical protein
MCDTSGSISEGWDMRRLIGVGVSIVLLVWAILFLISEISEALLHLSI